MWRTATYYRNSCLSLAIPGMVDSFSSVCLHDVLGRFYLSSGIQCSVVLVLEWGSFRSPSHLNPRFFIIIPMLMSSVQQVFIRYFPGLEYSVNSPEIRGVESLYWLYTDLPWQTYCNSRTFTSKKQDRVLNNTVTINTFTTALTYTVRYHC